MELAFSLHAGAATFLLLLLSGLKSHHALHAGTCRQTPSRVWSHVVITGKQAYDLSLSPGSPCWLLQELFQPYLTFISLKDLRVGVTYIYYYCSYWLSVLCYEPSTSVFFSGRLYTWTGFGIRRRCVRFSRYSLKKTHLLLSTFSVEVMWRDLHFLLARWKNVHWLVLVIGSYSVFSLQSLLVRRNYMFSQLFFLLKYYKVLTPVVRTRRRLLYLYCYWSLKDISGFEGVHWWRRVTSGHVFYFTICRIWWISHLSYSLKVVFLLLFFFFLLPA